MDTSSFETLENCETAIRALELCNHKVPKELLAQRDKFLAEKQAKEGAINSDTPIYSTLVANYPYGVMPQEKKDVIEGTVSKLLEEGEKAKEPGLLLGKIQCGKTDTFEDIIGLAFDKGIDIAIVLTKGTKPLTEQTLKRMEKDYAHFKPSDKLSRKKSTIYIHDIMNVWKNIKKENVDESKTVIVCKKQATNLNHLIDMFDKKFPFLKKKKVLIVDDEADFASRNYKAVKLSPKTDENGAPVEQEAELEMAKISQQIDDFREIPEYCRYLQVTATPYCLYLQPGGMLNLNGKTAKPFRPRFTEIVPTHAAYVGGKEYFEDSQNPESMYSHLYHKVDQKCVDVLGHEDKRYLTSTVSSGNIYGLTYSLIAYFMATAIRRIQTEAEDKDYRSSALIHVEIDKKNHIWQDKVVNRLIDAIKKSIVDNDKTDRRVWCAIDINYDDFAESNKKGRAEGLLTAEIPSKEEVIEEMRKLLTGDKYCVQKVNSDETVSALLNSETGELKLDSTANIFIGGNILDRGITIKNMLCFFYGRDPKKFQQDTVLQHARMYGSRSKEDMAVTRFHTTERIYDALKQMNALDDQLREWFIKGHDSNDENAVFVGYDNDIKPCAAQKIRASNALTLKGQKRTVPAGFWTKSNTQIKKTVADIDALIENSPHYNEKDEDGFFEIDKETVKNIINKISSTFVYDEKQGNLDRKNDLQEMLCAIEYCTSKSNGKLYALHRKNRSMSRLRANGCFIDAPDDGRTDTTPSRKKAIDVPVIMFLRQNGKKELDPYTEKNIGWNDAPFYWPVFMSQQNIDPVMYSFDQSKKKTVAPPNYSNMLESIDPNDVIIMTIKGDLAPHFGEEGNCYTVEDDIVETRLVKETTANRYLEMDAKGKYKLNPEVTFDRKHDHGVYSRNNDVFPFVLKPYKYMVLRNRRDAYADVMLLELHDPQYWHVIPDGKLNAYGELIDPTSPKGLVLAHGSDFILDEKMSETYFEDQHLTLWWIQYVIKKVLKFRVGRPATGDLPEDIAQDEDDEDLDE